MSIVLMYLLLYYLHFLTFRVTLAFRSYPLGTQGSQFEDSGCEPCVTMIITAHCAHKLVKDHFVSDQEFLNEEQQSMKLLAKHYSESAS